MSKKTFIPENQSVPVSQIGATLEALASTIAARQNASDESYTHQLLTGNVDKVLKKLMEESGEVALAAKDIESWATSTIAAQIAANADGIAGAPSGEEPPLNSLQIDLPEEYTEAVDHLRYEAADVVYHLMVVLERYGIDLEEFAAELNMRMTEDERPEGGVCLKSQHVQRGK